MTGRLGPVDVPRFRRLLEARLGWSFPDTDQPQLEQVLRRRSAVSALSPAAYLRRLSSEDEDGEWAGIAEHLAITETYFFRHGEQFRALAEEVLPERIAARAGQRSLGLLSVGCSSGEEAYTLAIVARQARPDPGWLISVLGVDVNPAVLRRAAAARYSAWSLRETPDAVRERWFRPRDGGYEVDPAIRDTARFRQYNAAGGDATLWRPGRYDVIFCRNLLMYLTPEVSAALVERMTGALAPGGYLFLGHTDSLGPRPAGLEPRHGHGTFYYRRPAPELVAASAARPSVAAPPEDRSSRALSLLRDERFAEALALVEPGGGHRDPQDLLLYAVLLAQAGRLADAEMTCRRLLDVDGLYPDAHHLLGVCLEGGASVDVAIGHYRLAAYLDPDFAMPRLRLGLLARQRGDVRAAGAELERALLLLPEESDERIALFGGGFGRIALGMLCRAELDACGVPR